ncbi:MAG: hypothetical protein ACR2NN_24945 [Bryobacteraceae bacterium]
MTAAISAPDQLRDYLRRWAFETILDRKPDERLTREEIRFRVLRKAFSNPEFERELVRKTRFVCAIAYDEGLGIDPFEFVKAILAYHVLRETPTRIYMELPNCHKGCTLPGVPVPPQPRSTCHICEKAFPLPKGAKAVRPDLPASEVLSRKKIEGHIQNRVIWDSDFAHALHANPLETYARYASELCAGRFPRYLGGVTELRLLHESEREMFFVFPTRERFELEIDC